ncbi:hypothetical protein PVK06_034160 [Gossypium arboreum]|uniref:Retrovirus-related Pol polyprotein from transposon TNT 1-94 n=1 Tax=Gossypium arboreum TaxID=29729 RepID=A0ABR0NEC9_GOSAR|nr:hypothetical protein PVK06_034160 [Gossypium arboreum]
MRAFIVSVNKVAWEAIEDALTRPTIIAANGITCLKERSKYTDVERRACHENSQALNAIFGGVDLDQLKVIFVCEFAKEAWTILKNQHEGNDVIRMSKLLILTNRFENLKMFENKTISEFYARLCEISNRLFALISAFLMIKWRRPKILLLSSWMS